jgi:hypothetical protein
MVIIIIIIIIIIDKKVSVQFVQCKQLGMFLNGIDFIFIPGSFQVRFRFTVPCISDDNNE